MFNLTNDTRWIINMVASHKQALVLSTAAEEATFNEVIEIFLMFFKTHAIKC